MSTPAGWYDDGSGRQRWWDGERWTEQGMTADPVGLPRPSTLGFIGLGLAILGTVLACIPTVVTFIIGGVVLLAAFVVSLIAIFKKNTRKWPSIFGIALSIVGGVVGGIVFATVLLFSLAGEIGENLPSGLPSAPASEQPSGAPTTDAGDERPSPEELAEGYLIITDEPGLEEYRTPEVAECMGQFYYESDLPVDLLERIAAGEIITYDGVGQEQGEQFERVTAEGYDVCVPL